MPNIPDFLLHFLQSMVGTWFSDLHSTCCPSSRLGILLVLQHSLFVKSSNYWRHLETITSQHLLCAFCWRGAAELKQTHYACIRSLFSCITNFKTGQPHPYRRYHYEAFLGNTFWTSVNHWSTNEAFCFILLLLSCRSRVCTPHRPISLRYLDTMACPVATTYRCVELP